MKRRLLFLVYFWTVDWISDTVRELLVHVPAVVKSDPPSDGGLVEELGDESGLSPLHLAAFSGNENVVRLLLNSAGVQVDAATAENVIKNTNYE